MILESCCLGLGLDADDDPADGGVDDDLPVPDRGPHASFPGAQVRAPDRPCLRIFRPLLTGELRFGKVQLEADPGYVDRVHGGRVVGVHGEVLLGVARRGASGKPGPGNRPRRLVYLRHDGRLRVRIEPVRVEERDGFAQRVNVEPDGLDPAHRLPGPEYRPGDRDAVVFEAPEEDRQVGQVVPDAPEGYRGFHVCNVGEGIERRPEQAEHRRVAQGDGPAPDRREPGDRTESVRWIAARVGPLVVEVLVPDEVLSQLDAVDAPPGQVVGQPLDARERTLAAAQRHGVGHVGPQRPGVAVQAARAEQVPDVGDHPVVARLDEQVVVERLDVLVDGAEDPLDERQVAPELARRTLLLVLDAVDLR
jgi:hypothetical protein